MIKRSIVIVGSFPQNETEPITQAAELFRTLKERGYDVIAVSKYRNKWRKLLDIIFTLLFYKNKYSIAIIQFYSGNSFVWQYIAAHIVKRLNKKLIFTIHGGNVPDRIKALPNRYIPLLRLADIITAPSQYIITYLKEYEIPATFIENTIPLKKYPFYDKESIKPVIFWMRAFSDIYNPGMAVKCVQILKEHYPNVKLYMGGPDLGKLDEIKKLIDNLGLKENIEIVGFMNFEQKKQYALLCDVYISTNKIDNAPVTFLEMWAMGVPVISTNIGGIPFIIEDNRNALLVKEDDFDTMAKKIKMLIEDDLFAKAIISNAREKVKAYDEEVVFNKWDKLLTSI